MLFVRIIATIFAGPFLLIGIAWFLQGINVLPGSFMTGHIQWSVYGTVLFILGALMVWWLNKPTRP